MFAQNDGVSSNESEEEVLEKYMKPWISLLENMLP